LLHDAIDEEQPEPDWQPAGHVVSALPPQTIGSHVTSHAHADEQVTPLVQLPPPRHWTLQALVPQSMTPPHV